MLFTSADLFYDEGAEDLRFAGANGFCVTIAAIIPKGFEKVARDWSEA
jgi:hypothetical protein